MVSKMVWLFLVSSSTKKGVRWHTRNAALYGIPIGKLAIIANTLLAMGDLKARLCEISWMAKNRFWLAVAPITYAVTRKGHESIEVLRRRYAQVICRQTTPRTTYFVRGSGPQSLIT